MQVLEELKIIGRKYPGYMLKINILPDILKYSIVFLTNMFFATAKKLHIICRR